MEPAQQLASCHELNATVHVVDDDPATCRWLQLVLSRLGHELTFHASAESFLDLRRSEMTPGCLIVDLHLPHSSGLELLCELKRRFVELPAILISGEVSIAEAVQAMRLGAMDVMQKPLAEESFVASVREAVFQSLAAWRQRQECDAQLGALSPRELEVMRALMEGKKTVRIAREMAISPSTVEKHRIQVLRKLRVDSVVDLLRKNFHGDLSGRRLNEASPPA